MVGNKEYLQNLLERNFSEKFNVAMDEERKLFLATEIVDVVISQLDEGEQILWGGFQKNIENLWSVVPIVKKETKKFWELFSANASILFVVTNQRILCMNLVDLLEKREWLKVSYEEIYQIVCGSIYSMSQPNPQGVYVLTKTEKNFEIHLSAEAFQSLREFLEENPLPKITKVFVVLEQESIQDYWKKLTKNH